MLPLREGEGKRLLGSVVQFTKWRRAGRGRLGQASKPPAARVRFPFFSLSFLFSLKFVSKIILK
jgi:hypothetical protein